MSVTFLLSLCRTDFQSNDDKLRRHTALFAFRDTRLTQSDRVHTEIVHGRF